MWQKIKALFDLLTFTTTTTTYTSTRNDWCIYRKNGKTVYEGPRANMPAALKKQVAESDKEFEAFREKARKCGECGCEFKDIDNFFKDN